MSFAVASLLLLPFALAQDEQRYTPSSTANILAEQYLNDLSYQSSLITIDSDVPVTLQKYSDTSQSFLMGAEPVPQNLGMVLVTSDCSSDETSVVPEITVDGDAITVRLGVDGQDMGFLQETTTYETFWSYVYGMCGLDFLGYEYTSSTELNVALIEDNATSGSDAPAASIPSSTPTMNVTYIAEATQAAATSDTSSSTSGSSTDYDQCGFTCCANSDCGERCCIEGICQDKENDFDLCAEPPIKPNNDEKCGAVAYKNFQVEGNCPNGNLPLAGATIPGEAIVTSTSATTTSEEMMTLGSSTTAASIDRTTTSPEPQVPNPCGEGKCIDLNGECAMTVMCLNDPCQADDNGCGGAECIANYCGGCNALCVISTSEVDATEAATTTTPATDAIMTTENSSTNASLSESSLTTSTILNESPCVQGKCLNFAGTCAREVICMTHPCDEIECNPDQECIANLCGGCNAFCSGGVTEAPTDAPSEVLIPASTLASPLVTPMPVESGPEPVQVVDEIVSPSSSPTESVPQSAGNPPSFDLYQNPQPAPSQTTPNQPTPNSPENPVVVVVNVPVQTVPVSAGGDGEGTETAETPATNSVDILDTPIPTETPIPSITPSALLSPSKASVGNTTGTSSPSISFQSPAPTFDVKDRSVDFIKDAGDNSGFSSRHSFHVRVGLTLIAILVAVIFSHQDGTDQNRVGLCKITVAAVAVTSLLSRSDSRGSVRRNVQTRALQSGQCIFNVEILYDGCTKSVQVSAPAARVIDVLMSEFNSSTNKDNECQTDYNAALQFPYSNSTDVDLIANETIPAYSYSDWQCLRAIEGRPFIDGSGKGIQAMPLITDIEMKVEWSGEAVPLVVDVIDENITSTQSMLGNEWVQRALGEHSSIASFSAFSIALMTNAAPSSLVEDSLVAAMDEVRHARTSFDIASKLLGKNVEPSSLPHSKHEFDQDLVKLGLAVAREGCVDETLSAISAAVESSEVTNKQGKYATLNVSTASWIRDELTIIAVEEASHSALAWRTLKWTCSIDSSVCDVVQTEVFDKIKLDMRFKQRAEGNESLAEILKAEWGLIYNAFNTSTLIYEDEGVSYNSLVATVTKKIMHGMKK